jgi:predicted RNase H-like HicB family nuclease
MLGAKRNYKILYKKDEDGKYTAIVPELPGCISCGNTKKAAMKNIQKAIVAYEESLKEHNNEYAALM